VGYAAGDALFFSVSRNEKACTDWRNAVWVYENIDHEVFSGRFGLMDVQRLRDAEQLTKHRLDRVDATLDQIKRMTTKWTTVAWLAAPSQCSPRSCANWPIYTCTARYPRRAGSRCPESAA